MSAFSELNKYTLAYNRKINKFLEPISNNFNVNHFWYYSLTNEGYYTCLGSNAEWMEHYYAQKLYLPNPHLKNPKNFNSGVSFRPINATNFGSKRIHINQSLVFLQKTNKGVEGFGLASNLPKESFEELCLNEIPLLKLFVKRFEEEFDPVLCKLKSNYVDLASLVGGSFNEENSKIQSPSIDRESLLKYFQLSELLDLTPRERDVLLYISKGWFAVQIADHLQLSKRTVEHYTENIKNKLNCYSKAELIQKAHNFLSLGYSLP